MGVDTWVRDFLRSRYRGAFGFETNEMPTTCVVDFMQFVKVVPSDINTLDELIKYFVNIIMSLFSKYPSIARVIVQVDRAGIHSPVKSLVTHVDRYKKVDVLDATKGPWLPTKGTGLIPSPWLGFSASGPLMRRELYPRIFNAIMGDGYVKLKEGQSIILHGFPGRGEYVSRHAERPYESVGSAAAATTETEQVRLWLNSELPITPVDERRDRDLYNRIYYVERKPPCEEWPRGVILKKEWKEAKNDVGEADVAIVYYDHFYPYETYMIVINDGDAFPILLLYAIERHMADNNMRGRHILRLPFKKAAGTEFFAEGRVPRHEYVDINQLFCLIKDDKQMLAAGVQHRILTMVFLIVMSGTDFLKHCMKGLGAEKVVWETFRSKMPMFRHMVQMPKGVPSHTRAQRDIVMDEDAFRQFVYYCYLQKYGKSARGKKKITLTYDVLAAKCASLKKSRDGDTQYMLPQRNQIRVWSRQVLWNLLYWKNGFLGSEYAPDPFERYDGLPYYGYEKDPEPRIAGYVSARQKPVDETMAQHLVRNQDGYRLRKRRNHAEEDVDKVVTKQRNVIRDFEDHVIAAQEGGNGSL
jgi:hypothetical protein